MSFLIFIVGLLGFAIIFDKVYSKIDLERYSPKWEYFIKSFLYGVIMAFTLLYGKNSINEVNPLEWAIIAVSAIEGGGNYISYLKESKKVKGQKMND